MEENKKVNKKKILILAIILIIVVVGIILVLVNKNKTGADSSEEIIAQDTSNEEKYVEVTEEGVKKNKSSKIKESKTEKGIEVSNFQISAKDGSTDIYADITNRTGKPIETAMVSIIFLDDQGNEVTTVGVGIGELEVDAKTTIQAQSTMDFANVYDYKIVVE